MFNAMFHVTEVRFGLRVAGLGLGKFPNPFTRAASLLLNLCAGSACAQEMTNIANQAMGENEKSSKGKAEAEPGSNSSTGTGGGMPPDDDKWSREPKSVQDKMALDAAKNGEGQTIIRDLGDPRYKGMDKMELKVKSDAGRDSVVHYVKDPKTGEVMDFKFKKHSID
jgi:hypothetical protein